MYSKERVKYFKTLIKSILVMKPDASAIVVQETLENQQTPIELDRKFINRLTKEIDNERTKNTNDLLLNTAIVKFLERIKETDKHAWAILTDKTTSKQDRLRAIAEIRKNGVSSFNVMFDAGVFDRKLGEVKYNMADVMQAVEEIEAKEKLLKEGVKV